MAEGNKPSIVELDWDDDDEFTEEVDNSAADFENGWFAVEIRDSECIEFNNDWGKSRIANVMLTIVDDDTFEGLPARLRLQMNSKSIGAAKTRKAFLNALADEDTGERPNVTYKRVTDTEGNKKVILDGIEGERFGALIEVRDGKFLNVKDEMMCSLSALPDKQAGMEAF